MQRWYEKYNLPVHKVGGDKGSIFAFTDELDKWMKHRVVAAPISEEQYSAIDQSHLEPNHFSWGNLEPISGAHHEKSAQLVSSALRMWQQLSPDNIDQIVRTYQRASVLDPWNAYAASGLALSLIVSNLMEVPPPSSGYGSAREMTKRAMEIAPDLDEAKCCECWLNMVVDHDWQRARIGFDSILKANDSCRYALAGRAMLHIAESRLQEAGDLLARGQSCLR